MKSKEDLQSITSNTLERIIVSIKHSNIWTSNKYKIIILLIKDQLKMYSKSLLHQNNLE